MTPAMDHGGDARAEELSNLKLALATFAMHLDVFEMRMNRGSRDSNVALHAPALGRKHQGNHQREKDWWSIRSLGNKPDA